MIFLFACDCIRVNIRPIVCTTLGLYLVRFTTAGMKFKILEVIGNRAIEQITCNYL